MDGDWDVDGFPGLMVVDSREHCWQFGAADRDGTEGGDPVDVEEAFVEGAEKDDPVEGNEEGDPVDVEEAFVEGSVRSLIEGVQETTGIGEENFVWGDIHKSTEGELEGVHKSSRGKLGCREGWCVEAAPWAAPD